MGAPLLRDGAGALGLGASSAWGARAIGALEIWAQTRYF